MSHRFDPTILREYDIRGIVGEQLAEVDAEAVGRSFATILRREGGKRIALGSLRNKLLIITPAALLFT